MNVIRPRGYYGWMDGWMDGWMNGHLDGCMARWMDRWRVISGCSGHLRVIRLNSGTEGSSKAVLDILGPYRVVWGILGLYIDIHFVFHII